MGLESQAVSARVTKHFVTIFNKTCKNLCYLHVTHSGVLAYHIYCLQDMGIIMRKLEP